jgi:hypothetical protein
MHTSINENIWTGAGETMYHLVTAPENAAIAHRRLSTPSQSGDSDLLHIIRSKMK